MHAPSGPVHARTSRTCMLFIREKLRNTRIRIEKLLPNVVPNVVGIGVDGNPFAKPFHLRSGLRMANFHIVRHLQSGIGFFPNFGTAIAKQAPDLGTGIAILQ